MKEFIEMIMKAEVLKADDKRSIRFIGSDNTLDRQGEIITHAGWNTENYMKNPVFLWAHNYNQPPIGKTVKLIKSKDKGLLFDVEFVKADMYPLADMIYNMYKDGFLSAVSVGFMSDFKDREYSEAEEAIITRKKELLELSAVPVPANPNALQQNGIKEVGEGVTSCQFHKFQGAMTEYNNFKRINELEKKIFIMSNNPLSDGNEENQKGDTIKAIKSIYSDLLSIPSLGSKAPTGQPGIEKTIEDFKNIKFKG